MMTTMQTNIILRSVQLVAAFLTITFMHEPAVAQSKVGTTAAQFLGISVGARPIGMGGAYVASSEDVSSLYWNPGAFAQSGKTQFAFTNTEWLVGTKFQWFGLAYNIDGENFIGVSLTSLDYGDEDVTTVEFPEGTGEKWSAKDLAIGISYSRLLTDRFSLGGTVKYVSQTLWNESASAFAFDLGLLFVTDFNGLRLGMSMSNFGGDLKLDGKDLLTRIDINTSLVGNLKTEAWPMPILFRVGVAMDVVKSDELKLTVAADALRPGDNEESLNLGGELGWNDMIFVRGGYKSLLRTKSQVFQREDLQEGLSLGAGLKYRAEGIATLEVNYAFTKFGLFGNLNTITVGVAL